MKKVSIFLAEGFEEVEALTQVDLLRRAGAEVTMVSISGAREVAGSHGIVVTADKIFAAGAAGRYAGHPAPEGVRSSYCASAGF